MEVGPVLDREAGGLKYDFWGVVYLFKIPHKPPAGSLKVLHAPARRGGIRRASQTKIYNLETRE
jgi:hypothetical protein